MDGMMIAGLMAAGVSVAIGLNGDIEGAADAIGDAVCSLLRIEQESEYDYQYWSEWSGDDKSSWLNGE